MRLRDQLRIHAEAIDEYQKAKSQGKTHDECCQVVAEAMREKYGASIDWAKIIQIIMLIFSLFEPMPTP